MVDVGPSVTIFDRDGNLASLQRSVLRAIGASRNNTVESEQALLKELVIGRGLLMINWIDDWDELVALIRTIRCKTTSPDPMVAIVVLSAKVDNSRTRMLVDAGVSSVVSVPFSAGHIIKHVRYVTTKAWRFIDAENYFGPDRRVRSEGCPEEGERRTAQCRILEGEELAAERLRMRTTALTAFEIKVSRTA
jgi:hypothetical protein